MTEQKTAELQTIPVMEPSTATRDREIVRSQIAMAKSFPRDEHRAEQGILRACERFSFAERALYRYSRGGQTVEGASIRLAEALANRWGNIDCGWKVVECTDEESILEAWAHDLETNNRKSVRWQVRHIRSTKMGTRRLTDPRDVYENTANEGARRLRACILAVIPWEITEAAVDRVRKTIIAGDKSMPLKERISRMLSSFHSLGVTQDMIETKLGHGVEAIGPENLVELQGIFNSLRDNVTKREDWFLVNKPKSDSVVAQLLAAQKQQDEQRKDNHES